MLSAMSSPESIRSVGTQRLWMEAPTRADWWLGVGRADDCGLDPVREAGGRAGPVEGPVVGTDDLHPLAEVPEKDAAAAGGAGGGRHEVAALEQLVAAQLRQITLDIGEVHVWAGHQPVEVVH